MRPWHKVLKIALMVVRILIKTHPEKKEKGLPWIFINFIFSTSWAWKFSEFFFDYFFFQVPSISYIYCPEYMFSKAWNFQNWDVHCILNANYYILSFLSPWSASWAQKLLSVKLKCRSWDGRYFRKAELVEALEDGCEEYFCFAISSSI